VNPLTCQAAMHAASGYIKTLMIQDTLAEPEWANRLGGADRRGLIGCSPRT
jgi:hypothetical protein